MHLQHHALHLLYTCFTPTLHLLYTETVGARTHLQHHVLDGLQRAGPGPLPEAEARLGPVPLPHPAQAELLRVAALGLHKGGGVSYLEKIREGVSYLEKKGGGELFGGSAMGPSPRGVGCGRVLCAYRQRGVNPV